MNVIESYQHDWFLIEISDNKMVYTNATSEKIYRERADSAFSIYTLTIYFSGKFKKVAENAIIKVNSSQKAVEQDIHHIYFMGDTNVYEDLVLHLNSMNLPRGI